MPSTNMAVPIPVPNVTMNTTPRSFSPDPEPKPSSAYPAASASLTTVVGRPRRDEKRPSTSAPIQALSTVHKRTGANESPLQILSHSAVVAGRRPP